MAPRHVLVYIPQGAGFTQSNLKELARLAEKMKDALSYGINITDNKQRVTEIFARIKKNGGYANKAALEAAIMPYLVKFVKLNRALRRSPRNIGQNYQNAKWRTVQEAAGKFKALRNVAALRRSPSPGSRRVGSKHNTNMVASLMRPYMLASSTPVTMTWNRYISGPPRPRARRAQPSSARRTPSPNRAATVTRSGRRSVKPRT